MDTPPEKVYVYEHNGFLHASHYENDETLAYIRADKLAELEQFAASAHGKEAWGSLQHKLTEVEKELSQLRAERDRLREALPKLLSEGIAWGAVYRPVITNDQWDEMRNKKADDLTRAALAAHPGEGVINATVTCSPDCSEETKEALERMIKIAYDEAVAGRIVDDAQSEKCVLPPSGWRCTRAAGHEGPCAAVPAHPGEEGIQLTPWANGSEGESSVPTEITIPPSAQPEEEWVEFVPSPENPVREGDEFQWAKNSDDWESVGKIGGQDSLVGMTHSNQHVRYRRRKQST